MFEFIVKILNNISKKGSNFILFKGYGSCYLLVYNKKKWFYLFNIDYYFLVLIFDNSIFRFIIKKRL